MLLLGSSLLVGGLVLAEGSHGAALCDATPLAVPALANDKASAAGPDLFNPPPPAHDAWLDDWDGLHSVPPSIDPQSRPVMVTRHLIFVRHGQYVLPTAATAGQDPVLTELGHAQAKLTGERLKSLGYDVKVIHVSSMARARQTAEDIAASFPGVPVRVSPLIAEGVPSAHVPQHPSWRPDAESLREDPPRIRAGFDSLVHRWREHDGVVVRSKAEWDAVRAARLKHDPNELHAGKQGESSAAAAAAEARNIAQQQQQQQHGGLVSTSAGTIDVSGSATAAPVSVSSKPPLYVERYELVVCHGNVIRYSVLRALQLPVQAWLRLAIYNTGISHMIIRPNGHVALQSLGDTGHLPGHIITYS